MTREIHINNATSSNRLHTNRGRFVDVISGTRAPAWKDESIDGDGPILDRGDDQYLDLLANVETALGALQIGVAT